MDKIIAHGSFGIVYQGTNLNGIMPVAIKRIFLDKRFKNRELEILEQVDDHPYILEMEAHYYTNGDRPMDQYLHIVSALYQETLSSLITKVRRTVSASESLT